MKVFLKIFKINVILMHTTFQRFGVSKMFFLMKSLNLSKAAFIWIKI